MNSTGGRVKHPWPIAGPGALWLQLDRLDFGDEPAGVLGEERGHAELGVGLSDRYRAVRTTATELRQSLSQAEDRVAVVSSNNRPTKD